MHPVRVTRTRAVLATFAALLLLACVSAGIAGAASRRSAPSVQQPAIEQPAAAAELAAEAAEVQEEAVEVSAEAAPAFRPMAMSRRSASKSRKIARLTRQIHHLRVVKERIRARRRHLRELPPGSKRRQHGLAVQTDKLLRKRNRLFFIQNERSELEGR
jgi:sensor c-di-GMP phosphodiesterase-like protein